MKWKYYGKLINTNTIRRCDVTPLFGDAKVFGNLVKDLMIPFKNVDYNTIVGLDALGFVIGGAIAIKNKKRFVPVRKGGKLPGVKGTILQVSFKDYSNQEKQFEMNKNSIKAGDKVIIVDEWIETGTQAKAAIELIEKQGGKVVGIAAINADKNANTEILFSKYNLRPIHIKE